MNEWVVYTLQWSAGSNLTLQPACKRQVARVLARRAFTREKEEEEEEEEGANINNAMCTLLRCRP